MTIGNSLKLSQSFPPSHTVHDAFTSYGVPSFIYNVLMYLIYKRVTTFRFLQDLRLLYIY